MAVDGTGGSVLEVELSETDVEVPATSELSLPQAASRTRMPARTSPIFFPMMLPALGRLGIPAPPLPGGGRA